MDSVLLFHRFLSAEKRYSLHTCEAYMLDVRQFQDFIKNQYNFHSFQEVLSIHIRSWLAKMNERGIDTRSIRRKCSSLNTFYRFLLKRELATSNPLAKIIAPKIKKRLPIIVKESEMIFLDSDKNDDPDDYKEMLTDLIVKSFYSLGIRRSELIDLKYKNVKLDQGQLKVMGKGGKERIIPFGNELRQNFERYIIRREDIKLVDVENFFVMKNGKKLYPKMVYLLVSQWLKYRSNSSKKSPHILRHSFATHLADHGADIYAIKELLGHSSLAATQVYTHNSIEQLRKAYSQAHPRAFRSNNSMEDSLVIRR
ncbi:MAG: tyrosine-type recombinase/integrase [Saprospiraceae bacterium]|nr:tyrosine-type recombinase/integrase [Saprospiraceae bacterium]